ncbi:S-layer homology domain-containing protein [Anaerovorax odorimutans]|uniref:S-layer homology domain-containing protein n=1 Tax=Anaerovorax odorimutans TaxID=109327 RepID=UPI0003FC36D6|nr:S-layer homology domain-containing protein [Anaerovorax odorimutans]
MRKILSFVLVLSLVLGSFSMAFAADSTASTAGLSDIEGIANEDAIQVNYDLGIVTGNPDGTYLPEKAVTRAEFAALITRALAIPDSALAGYKNTKFKDTVGYGWAVPYLGFCESKGIILGDGNGNAMPGRTINTNEAMTMALRAIGYTANSAELVGTWPSNYVTVAQNNSMYDDVAKVTNVDKANAAQIIYNALTVQKVSVNSDGETIALWDDSAKTVPANLLSTGLNCDSEEDKIITGADYDSAVMNITKYMGAYGTAYTNDDGDIVAFTVDSTPLTGSFDGDKFEADGVEYTLGTNTFTTPKAISNTDAVDTALLTKAGIEAFATASADDDVTINVDLSGKTIKDIYSVVGWTATSANVADDADVEDIADDNSLLGYDFVEDDNNDIDTASFTLVGVSNLNKIKEDNVVYVYTDADNDIRKVAVGTEIVEGIVAEENTGSDAYVIIDGKKYEQAEFVGGSACAADALPSLDDSTKLSLDAYGYVYDVDSSSSTPDKFAVTKVFVTPAGVDNAKAKIYTSDDATKTVTFEDWNAEDIDFTNNVSAPAITAGALIGYDVDAEGIVDTLDLTAVHPASAELQSSKVLKIGAGYLDIAKNVAVFTYTGATNAAIDLSTTELDVVNISDIDTGDVFSNDFQYIYNSSDKEVVAILVNDTYNNGGSDDIFAVLNSATKVKDGSDTVQKLVGFVAGKDYTKNADSDSALSTADFNAVPTIAALYKIEETGSGDVKTATLVGAPNGDEACMLAGGTNGLLVTDVNSDRTVVTVTSGGVESKYTVEAGAVVYKINMKDSNTAVDYYEVSKLSSLKRNANVWLYDTKTGDDHDGIANVVIYVEY